MSSTSSSSPTSTSISVYFPADGTKDARSFQALRVLSLNFFSKSLIAPSIPNGPFNDEAPLSPYK